MSADEKIEGLLNIAKHLDGLFIVAIGLCLTVILTRVFAKISEIEIYSVRIPLKYFVAVCVALTVLHFLFSVQFIQQIESLAPSENVESAALAWQKLTNADSYLFLRMEERNPSNTFLRGIVLFDASGHDTTFWITFVFSIMLVGAVMAALWPAKLPTPWVSKVWVVFSLFSAGATFASVNWLIGSQWAAQASQLAGPQ